jgi:hypothetical protein
VRGQLTEVFGPPGSGKTAFWYQFTLHPVWNLSNIISSLQAVASILRDTGHIVWVDSAFPVPVSRLEAILPHGVKPSSRFHHYQAPGLAHMLALCHRQKAGFPPEHTSLMIIDDVSSIFPIPALRPPSTTSSNANRSQGSIFRSTLLASLSRIASTQNIAVVLTSDVTTRFRQESRAMLVGSLGGKEWEESMSSRIALFRDFAPRNLNPETIIEAHDDALFDRLRHAGVLKANGVVMIEHDTVKDVIPFIISDTGTILPITFPTPSSAPVLIKSPAPVRKRRLDEVPDSEEDWDAEVESLDGYEYEEPVEEEVQVLAVRPVTDIEVESRSKKAKIASNDND